MSKTFLCQAEKQRILQVKITCHIKSRIYNERMSKPYAPELPKTIPAFIWHFARMQRWKFIACILLPIFGSAAVATWPWANRLLINSFERFMEAGLPQGQVFYFIAPAIAFFFFRWLASSGFYRARKLIEAHLMARMDKDIKLTLLDRISHQSYTFFTNNFAGRIANKIGDLALSSRDLSRTLFNITFTIFFLIVSFILFLVVHWVFITIMLIWITAHISYNFYRVKTWNTRSHKSSELKSIAMGRAIDSISNYNNVKSFAGEVNEAGFLGPFHNRWERARRRLHITIQKDYIVMSLMSLSLIYIPAFYMLATLFQAGRIGIGDVAFVLISLDMIQEQIYAVSEILTDATEIWGTMDQAMWIVTTPISIVDSDGAKPLKIKDAKIDFKNVAFRYDKGKNTLFKNFSLSVKPGEKLGIVGHSGAGKSSMTHLLLRYFDTAAGQIKIDGQDIKKVTQESLRQAIAFIPQDTSLFHRTIYKNILYGRPDATREEVIAAAKQAYAHELILNTPDGYESLVGDRGIKLSVGQRQRIAIARAILKDAPILILDEATSALDSETEVYIQKSLTKLMENRTTIAIAHRLSTLRNMDRIIVLDKGKIVEEGSHNQLIKHGGLYARLWNIQSNGFINPDELT